MSNVRIVMRGHGRGEVFIDGNKIGGVKAVEFSTAVNSANLVKLTFNSEGIEVDGLADISHIGSEFKEVALDQVVLLKKIADCSEAQIKILQDIVFNVFRTRNAR